MVGWVVALGLIGHGLAAAQGAASSKTCGAASSSPEDVVQAQVEAFNQHDLDRFANCYTDDAAVKWLGGDRPDTKGIDALKTGYQFLTSLPKERGVEIVKRVVSGPIVVDLERPHGLPPNAPPRPDSVVIYEVRKGKIVNVWFAPK
jgi:hypothetical protein